MERYQSTVTTTGIFVVDAPPPGLGWWVVIPIYVCVYAGTNACRSGRVRGRGRSRGRSMYASVRGLRHLLHGLTVVGVAAAHNANLQDAYTAAVTSSVAADADLREAQRAQTTAQAKVDALQVQLLREHSEAQARDLVLAERVLERTRATVAECKADAKRSNARLARVESELDASRGALLRVCHPVV